jgi:hypothetical protein
MKCTSSKHICNNIQNVYEERFNYFSIYELETEEAQTVINLKGGPEKYKGKLPFK